MVCRTLHDSVFWDTKHKWNGSFLISYQSFSFSPRIFKYAKGDSLLFLLPPKIFFREFFKCPTPYFIKNDSSVKFSIRILGVQNRYANSSAPSLVTQDSLLKSEKNGIVRFAQQKLPGSHPLSSGIYIEIKSSISGDSVRTNSKVSIAYKGYFLDGQLMDQSPGDAPLEISMGQEKQVLDGLRIVLLHLKNGDKAKIILPSRLAYGSSGSSNGSIPPFTPLFYELKVINVK